ncbi:MAG: AcrB/AcrD/AcrF family protein [Acidobacteria bacterium]|nr:MAG: AcrB/AcrD/AcrF family protein [Acidobacteriota bacterium]REJ99318.1 MAG: AcrB/AcrD/AcrF family protein [Acidobacteriota bacterium]REK15660.1 MAG: AcrB/AcrD/AcrF family protein [Acidobacteriota bacterium]REK43643.1 MAG: AcrB/AcrD/AcrF family protein [Acidobacteriota bacterium]
MQWLAEICVKRPVFATMLILSLVVVGAFSFFSLGVDLFPKVDFPTITITTVNPGSSPQEIETEITEKIEEVVNTVSGIDELRSTSLEGVSQVFVQFILEKDVNIAAQEVENRVQQAIPNLPETAEQPTVQKLDSDAAPVLRIVVSSNSSLRDVTEVAKNQVKERIESINGVGQVQIVGGRERQVNVWVDPLKMRAFNITPVEVTAALRVQNLEFPGGRLDEGAVERNVRTLGKVRKVEEFEDVVVANRGGYEVKIKDIGTVEDGAEELRSQSFLNGKPAVTLIVSKQSGENTVAVAHAVKEALAEIEPTLPKDYRLQIIGDNSIFIENSLEAIETHLVEGSIFATIVIFLFLWNFRSTLIAALAIPTSIISTFALMYAMGYTLNSITMLSLTLMVGIVVDDAIVVLENIYKFVEEEGMSPYRAAIEGTRDIGLAVLATTFSLLAVFVPIGFMGGIVGRFMSSFGLTSAFAITVSLLVSFTLTPMLAARIIKWKKPEDENSEVRSQESEESSEFQVPSSGEASEPGAQATGITEENSEVGSQESGEGLPMPEASDELSPKSSGLSTGDGSKDTWFYRHLDSVYTKMIVWSMNHRWVILLSCLLVVVSIVPLFMFVGKNFLPVDDQSQYEVQIRTDEGTSLQAATVLMERIATDIRKLEGVTDTLITVGGGQAQAVNAGTVYVRLTDIGDRSKSQEELMAATRELLSERYPPDLRVGVQQVQAFSGGGFRNANVQFFIGGPDLDQLEEYSKKLVEVLKGNPDAVDVDSTLISGKPEVQLAVDRQRAADLGVRVGDVSQALNILVAGQQATTFNEGTEQYEVRVRTRDSFRNDISSLERLIVPSSKLGWVTLDRVVKTSEGTGPAAIDRINRQRQVTILANTRPGGSAVVIQNDLNQAVEQLNLGAEYVAGYVGQSKELQKAGFYFLLAIVLSFIFMYIVLAAQFESFIHPITILLTLPIAIPFGILSILIAGQTVNIFSGLGLLLLFGVVKKNAILVIDHTNNLRAKGMERYDAIIQGNRDRLRPILMTTIALIAGMMPLVVSSGAGAGTNRSVGVLIVGGQALCLLLTLLAVPVFYSYFDDLGNLKIFRRMSDGMQVVRRKTAQSASSIINSVWK